MSPPIPWQPETVLQGAVGMAWEKALPYARASRSEATLRVYAGAWQTWCDWCAAHHTDAVPARPEAVAGYLAALAKAGKSVSAINVALSAILFHHRGAALPLDRKHPVIAAVVGGITRTQARPVRRARPLGLDDLRRILAAITSDDVRSRRDRALLLIGFFGALRRSEIAALDLTGRSPIVLGAQGLRLHLTATKTSARTETVALPRRSDELCPVAAVEGYLTVARIESGPLFRAVSKSGRLLDRRLDATSIRHILRARLEATFAGLGAPGLARRLDGRPPAAPS